MKNKFKNIEKNILKKIKKFKENLDEKLLRTNFKDKEKILVNEKVFEKKFEIGPGEHVPIQPDQKNSDKH